MTADWLTAERATAWCRVLAVLLVIWLVLWIAGSHAGRDGTGTPFAADFLCYWAAGVLAASGHAIAAYDASAMAAVQHAAVTLGAGQVAPFLYPPTYLMLCVPLGLLGFWAALAVFTTAGLTPYIICVRRLLPARWAILPALAFPGVLVTAGNGQNGFFTGACFGGFMLLLDRSPAWAGICIGLLSCKPHLAVLVPVALVAARRWQALIAAGVTAAVLMAASWLAFGAAVWRAFPVAAGAAKVVLEQGLIDISKLQSAFSAVRLVGGPVVLAYAVQAAFAVVAVGGLVMVAWRRPGGRAEGAMLAVAALTATPYVADYDLAILAMPLAWLAGEAVRSEWRPWEKYAALAAYVVPIVGRGLAHQAGIPLGPIVLMAFLLVVGRRAGFPTHEDSGAGIASASRIFPRVP